MARKTSKTRRPQAARRAPKAARRAPKAARALLLRSYTIHREGQVNWQVRGDHHCGPKSEIRDGAVAVRYSASITCEPHLDARGFLFDQAALDAFIKRLATVPTTLSCEALVAHVAGEILAKMDRDVPDCRVRSLRLSLSPAPHAARVEAVYEVAP